MVLSYSALRVTQACGITAVGCCNTFIIRFYIVGGESDRSLYPSKGGVAYGSTEDSLLNAMVVFYLNDL